MKMKNSKTPQKGRPPSKEQEFLLEWGRESLKNNLSLINEALSKLITLNAAFAGGAIVQKAITAPLMKAMLTGGFLIAMAIAFLGYLPYKGAVNLKSPTEIKQHKERALRFKYRYLIGAAVVTFLGLCLAIFAVLLPLMDKN